MGQQTTADRAEPGGATVPAQRTCPRCRQTKPHTEYGRNRSTSHGLQAYCKPCQRERRSNSRGPGPRPDRRKRPDPVDVLESDLERMEWQGDLSGAHGGPAFLADPSASSDVLDAEEDALLGLESARTFLLALRWPVPPLLAALLPEGCSWVPAHGRPNRVHVIRGTERLLEAATPKQAALWAMEVQ